MPKLYYRVEPKGSQLARRSDTTIESLPRGFVFAFDAPHLVFASDTFDSAIQDPEDWEVVELHGRDAYDPGDIEGVAVKPTSVVRRLSLYEWTARQARGRDASAREYARSALDRMERRAAVPHRLDEDEPEAVVIRPVGWEAANDTPPSWARPGHLYRGMSEAEWHFVQQSGVIRSDERFAISGEGTNFAEDPGDAESYVNFGSSDPRKTGRPNYLVEIENDGSLKRWGDGYWKAREVPAALITRAWIMYPEAGAVVAEPVDVRAGGATLEMREDSLDSLIESTDAHYPRAGEYVDGRLVRKDVPNLDSIDGYMAESETLSGIRVVPMSDLGNPRSVFYAADDFERSERLAEQIRRSGEISPLIIGVDEKGPFIIEGAHRFVALYALKAKEFPAVVVVGQD